MLALKLRIARAMHSGFSTTHLGFKKPLPKFMGHLFEISDDRRTYTN
ncbi:hypothetical protein EBME_0890 [bacterium endosymbiont of Mortierella elongata FMR23-6]|nr:hypothetical protein EBME_0890 [bacterium endosymbiont of Mortierella elongata FMR23-6]